MEDAEKEKETLRQTINQMEELKRQQERALETLNKEVRGILFIPLKALEYRASWSYLLIREHSTKNSPLPSVFLSV